MISDATLQLMMPYLGYLEAEGLPKIDPLIMEKYGPVISPYPNEGKWTQSSSLHKNPEKIDPDKLKDLFFNPFFFSEGLIQWILQKPEDQITKNLIWSQLGYAITKKTTPEIFQELQGEILKISKALYLANKWANRNYIRQTPNRDTGVNFDCDMNDYEYGDCRYTSRRESWSVNVSRDLINEIKALSEDEDADLDDARQQGIDMLMEHFKESHQDSADSYGDYDYDNHESTDYQDFEDNTNYERTYDQILDS
jgi:hypothetical protein